MTLELTLSIYPPERLSIPITLTSGLFSIIQSANLLPRSPATPVINIFILSSNLKHKYYSMKNLSIFLLNFSSENCFLM